MQKVDEGKGGVGYEALIVTGELIQDLGTKKFVPRYSPIERADPIAEKTWSPHGFKLSAYFATVDEEFKKLVAQSRQEPPATKPPLGEISTSPASPLPTEPLAIATPAIADPASAD